MLCKLLREMANSVELECVASKKRINAENQRLTIKVFFISFPIMYFLHASLSDLETVNF